MADDEDLQSNSFRSVATTAATAIGATAAAVLSAIAAGIVVRAQDLASLADQAGVIRIDVESTAIRTLTYHLTTGAMAVVFTDGSVYPYPPVSMFNFLRFINATSKGSFYNREVRGRWG